MSKLDNNKGYSLVELMIAMAVFMVIFVEIMAFMNSSQRFYMNSAFEVELQTEAQQVVQQLEEIFIDAQVKGGVKVTNVSVSGGSVRTSSAPELPTSSYDDFVNVNIGEKFTVEWDANTTYEFELREAGYDPYAYLWMAKFDPSDVAAAKDWQLMGEYVNNITIDTSDFDDASRVVISVSMNNGKRSYETSKDVYMRNDLGSTMKKVSSEPSVGPNSLEILRCKEYDLASIFGSGYTFSFAPADAKAADNYYTISSNKIKCKDAYNDEDEATAGSYTVIGKSSVAGVDDIEIVVYTKQLMVGTDFIGIYNPVFQSATISDDSRVDTIVVQGIALEAASVEKYDVVFWYPPASNVPASETNKMVSENVASIPFTAGKDMSGTSVGSAGTWILGTVKMSTHHMSFDPTKNSIRVYVGKYDADNKAKERVSELYSRIKSNGYENMHFDCELKFKNRKRKVKFKIYAHPVYNYGGTVDYENTWDDVTDDKVAQEAKVGDPGLLDP